MLGKWLGLLAVGGAMAFTASLLNRRNGRRMNWNKLWNRTITTLGNKSVRRAMKKGRRMIRSWT